MTASPPAAERRDGGPPAWFIAVAVGSLLLGLVVVVFAVLGIGVGIAGPAPTMGPTGQAAEVTRALVTKALGDAGFQVQEPSTGYRPGESPALVNVPRRIVQAVLPEDPSAGYVVIYELPTPGDADRVGRDLVAYLGSGPGAIQYPRDTSFVVRRVGQTLVLFPWSAQASPDARVAEMAAALETVGSPVGP